tara:strand:- start:120 stop:245 length:126 start_codon:yes stop_codon:yes gene_type:complete
LTLPSGQRWWTTNENVHLPETPRIDKYCLFQGDGGGGGGGD